MVNESVKHGIVNLPACEMSEMICWKASSIGNVHSTAVGAVLDVAGVSRAVWVASLGKKRSVVTSTAQEGTQVLLRSWVAYTPSNSVTLSPGIAILPQPIMCPRYSKYLLPKEDLLNFTVSPACLQGSQHSSLNVVDVLPTSWKR